MTTDAPAVTPPPAGDYPVRLSIDYAEGPRNRLTTLVRPLLAIPILIVIMLVSGGSGAREVGRGGGFANGRPGSGILMPFAGMPGYGTPMTPETMRAFQGQMPGGMPAVMPAGMPAGMPGASVMPGAGAVGTDGQMRWDGRRGGGAGGFATAGGMLFLPTLLMLVFRRKYPRWWFDWNLELSRFGTRVSSYLMLQRDEYPSTDEAQAVHLDIDYPDATQLNRWLPLVKWLLAIPHYLVLLVLAIGLLLAWIVSWFAILITGRQPRGLFDYIVGVQRWGARVAGYAFMLVTDRYPPFSLK